MEQTERLTGISGGPLLRVPRLKKQQGELPCCFWCVLGSLFPAEKDVAHDIRDEDKNGNGGQQHGERPWPEEMHSAQ